MKKKILITIGIFVICSYTSVPQSVTSWPLTECNAWIRDIPTTKDFVPLGIVYMETKDHILKTLPDPKWGLQCFIFGGGGKTEDGKHTLIFQGRAPMVGVFKHRFSLDGGDWIVLPDTRAPMYFDNEGRIYTYPTVYNGGETQTSISYDEQGRRWIFKIENREKGIILEIEGKARGIPFWMGKAEGPYIIHGAVRNQKDFDTWGGFWECGTSKINLTILDKSYTFFGNFVFDRAYHRGYYLSAGVTSPVAFSCMYIIDKDFNLMLSHSINPSPLEAPVPFEHQARMNYFLNREEDFKLDNFKYSDNGGLQPSEFHIAGTFEGGSVDLTGKANMFWPDKWEILVGTTWWDSGSKHTWGRAIIEWNGTIILHGETIKVENAFGWGEFTRFEPS